MWPYAAKTDGPETAELGGKRKPSKMKKKRDANRQEESLVSRALVKRVEQYGTPQEISSLHSARRLLVNIKGLNGTQTQGPLIRRGRGKTNKRGLTKKEER